MAAPDRDRRADARCPGSSRLPIALVLFLASCPRGGNAPEDELESRRAGGGASSPPYAISVDAPGVEVGKLATTKIKVVPKGRYKMNLEFPLKLQVAAPEAASPRTLEMRAKQAAKLTEQELLLAPAFVIGAEGSHRFQATLRFSVCTEQLCEIKSESIGWTVVSR